MWLGAEGASGSTAEDRKELGPPTLAVGPGLCGNFNGDTTDDFTTSMGIAEGTASLFVDSWRAGNCPAALERETDPCSMSQLNSECCPGGAGWAGGPGGQLTHAGLPPPPQRCVRRPTVLCW